MLLLRTNDQDQPVCAADLFSESATHANSAASFCSHLRFIAICDSAIRPVAILSLDLCRMKHSSVVRLRQCVRLGKWIVLARQRFCVESLSDTTCCHVRCRVDVPVHSAATPIAQAQRPCRMRNAIQSPSKTSRNQTRPPASQCVTVHVILRMTG